MNDQEDMYEQVLAEMKKLNEKIEKLENEVEDVKFFAAPQPTITPAMIGQIGGILLGALVIISLFWI